MNILPVIPQDLRTTASPTFAGLSIGTVFNVETDGDTFWTGSGTGLEYGQIYEEDGSSTLDLAAQDTFYQVVVFTANGESNLATPDHTNDHITITKTGKYYCSLSVAFSQSSAVANEYDFHVKKNNGATDFPQISAHRDTSGNQTIGSTSASGIISLTAGDTVEVWVDRLTGGAVSYTITIETIQLTLFQIGG
jgi:hypothetical protein